jgi:hypothetical protein
MTGYASTVSVRTAIGWSLRVLSVALALATVAEFYGLLFLGWMVGLGTWAGFGYGAIWLVCQVELSVMAAIRVGKRPRRGALMLAGAVLASLPLVAWMRWLPHRGAVVAWFVGVAALVAVAGVIAERLPAPPARRRAGWRVALDELPAAGIRQDSGRE